MYHASRFGERTGGLHVSIWVHYSEKNDWGQGVLIDCASVITLDALSVITLAASQSARRAPRGPARPTDFHESG